MNLFFSPPTLLQYRRRARAIDSNEMSGRTNQPLATQFIARNIADAVNPKRGDVVADIGCGEGSMLIAASRKGAGRLVGVLPTQEEVDRFKREHGREIEIDKGTLLSTGLPTGLADITICNAVMIFVPKRKYGAALKELRRITKRDGTVYVGELLLVDERAAKTKWGNLKNKLRYIFYPISWCSPEEFNTLLSKANLEVVRTYLHENLDSAGKPYQMPTRQNFLLRAI